MNEKDITNSRLYQFFVWETLVKTKIINTQNKIDKLNKKLKDEYKTMTPSECEKIHSKIQVLEAELVKYKNYDL